MMIRRSVLAALLALAGCSENMDGTTTLGRKGSPYWVMNAPPQDLAAHFGQMCEAYGVKRGTAAFGECLQREITAAKARAHSDVASANASAAARMQQISTTPHMTTTNCNRLGSSVSCTTW